jgi:hypothetical protein
MVATDGEQKLLPQRRKPTISQRWVLQIWLLDLGWNQGPAD